MKRKYKTKQHIQLQRLDSMSDTTPAYQPQIQIFESSCVCGIFFEWCPDLTHGYTFHLAAHEVKSIPVAPLACMYWTVCQPFRMAALYLCASYACCWNVCFSFSSAWSCCPHNQFIDFPIQNYWAGIQCKCQQVGDLELRESISPSGWILTFVARGLLKTSIYCFGFKCHFQWWIDAWLKNPVETLISPSTLCCYSLWPLG